MSCAAAGVGPQSESLTSERMQYLVRVFIDPPATLAHSTARLTHGVQLRVNRETGATDDDLSSRYDPRAGCPSPPPDGGKAISAASWSSSHKPLAEVRRSWTASLLVDVRLPILNEALE